MHVLHDRAMQLCNPMYAMRCALLNRVHDMLDRVYAIHSNMAPGDTKEFAML